jgi:hypothetical protein
MSKPAIIIEGKIKTIPIQTSAILAITPDGAGKGTRPINFTAINKQNKNRNTVLMTPRISRVVNRFSSFFVKPENPKLLWRKTAALNLTHQPSWGYVGVSARAPHEIAQWCAPDERAFTNT